MSCDSESYAPSFGRVCFNLTFFALFGVTLALAGWSAYASQPTNFYIDRVLEFLITTKLFQPS